MAKSCNWCSFFLTISFISFMVSILIPVLASSTPINVISFGVHLACYHPSLASSRFCQSFVSFPVNTGRVDANAIQETTSAILDRLTQDARKTATIAPVDMRSIRLAVDDMVTLIESHDYQSGDLLSSQLRNLTKLISNAALSMAQVRTKVDIGVDRVLAKSALLFSRSMTRSGASEAANALCAEEDTHGCALLLPSSPSHSLSLIQQTSSLFSSILVDFAPLVEKAKSDTLAMEECLRQIQIMLVQEKIVASKETDRLSSSIMVFLGANKVPLAELEKREMSINTLLAARRDILSYMFASSDLLDQLSSDIREMHEVVATALDPSAQWETDFLAVISAGSQRMRLNRMMQRNTLDANDEAQLPSSLEPSM